MATVQRFRGDVEFYGNTANNLSLVPLTFYAAPSAQGTGDGLSSGNAATLQTILTSKMKAATYVVVKLASGNHVLSSTVTIADQLYLQLEADSYDNQNPPIICTTHSTGANISEDTSGNPSSSQTCAAHGYDEYPFLIQNSHVSLKNVWIHGIRYCLNVVNSFVELHGDTFFKLWAYNVSSTRHDGMAIYASQSQITGENATKFWIYHPRYQSTSDTFVTAVTPLYLTYGTEMTHSGTVTWVASTQINVPISNNMPTSNSSFLNEYLYTSIIVVFKSILNCNNLIIDNVLVAFSLLHQSGVLANLSQIGTGKLHTLFQAYHQAIVNLYLTSNISAENTTGYFGILGVCSTGWVIGGDVTGYGASATAFYVYYASALKSWLNILAENRASNLGFVYGYIASCNSSVVFNSAITTRNSGTDKVVVATMGSTITQIGGTNTCSAPVYTVGSGGRYIQSDGTVRT